MGKLKFVFSAMLKEVEKTNRIFVIYSQGHLLEFIKMWVPTISWLSLDFFHSASSYYMESFCAQKESKKRGKKKKFMGLTKGEGKKKSQIHGLIVKASRGSKTWQIQLH